MPSVELAEVVRVTGPIAHPSVKLDSMGAAKTAITIGGAIATGGWSLLATPLLNAATIRTPARRRAQAGSLSAARPARRRRRRPPPIRSPRSRACSGASGP